MSENSKNEGVNIERDNLRIFWTTSRTSMKFSEKMWLNIKSHKKKTRPHPLSRIYKFGTSYSYCKNLKWKKPFQDFAFSILGSWQSFCLSSSLSFLNIKLQQLLKLEVRERFPRYPSFLFWVQGKIEDSETSQIFYFSSKSISWPLSFCLS